MGMPFAEGLPSLLVCFSSETFEHVFGGGGQVQKSEGSVEVEILCSVRWLRHKSRSLKHAFGELPKECI